MPRLTLSLLATFFFGPGLVSALELEGRVETANGVNIEHARVELVSNGATVHTDTLGRFAISCDLPCLMLVTHPRFKEQLVDLQEAPEGPLKVSMEAKQAVFERIDVTASRSAGETFVAETVAATEIKVEERAAAPTTLTELVEGVAGVAENGQPGLFQVYSIRGVSRHRVLTLVSGMQITGERRAGVATSFIDPLLMGAVDVLRGPASTYYGSGALGGVVQIFPRRFEGLTVQTGWEEFGDQTYLAVGTGGDDWSVAAVRRNAEDDEVSDGTLQNTHFTQISAAIEKTWQRGDLLWELSILPSRGDDIGKPNLRFPNSRIVNYPREEHLLVKLGVASTKEWSAHVFVHPNSLETETIRPADRINFVENNAFDLGANFQRQWTLGDRVTLRGGLDYFGRRDVSADETETSLNDGGVSRFSSLSDGEQDEVSAYGTLRTSFGSTIVQLGSRLTWQQQQNGTSPSTDDDALTGFLGVVQPLGGGVELTANVGTGLRFPNLSERFFTGTTGRGGTVGNPDLEPERSVNLDLGLRYFGNRTFVSAQVFRLEVDDYIERVDLTDDVLTFVNLISGTIEGVEIEGFHKLNDAWTFSWNGHLIDGEGEDGSPLADISPDRFQVGLRYDMGRLDAKVEYQYRATKDDPGPGEVSVESADLVSAALTYDLRDDLQVTLRGRNLLDEDLAGTWVVFGRPVLVFDLGVEAA
ncbi:MAG: TonB-dependent receptor, partial [Acidobacteriota bacterium]